MKPNETETYPKVGERREADTSEGISYTRQRGRVTQEKVTKEGGGREGGREGDGREGALGGWRVCCVGAAPRRGAQGAVE